MICVMLIKKGRPTVILALASAIPEQVRLPVAFHSVAERNLLLMRDQRVPRPVGCMMDDVRWMMLPTTTVIFI